MALESDSGKQEILRALEANGKAFMDLFDMSVVSEKRKPTRGRHVRKQITETESIDLGEEAHVSEKTETELPENKPQPEVVVFTRPAVKTNLALDKSFMSSKVSRITSEADAQRADKGVGDDEADAETYHTHNDKELHQLVHTKLLSGSLGHSLGLPPAQRRRALQGRVLELASFARLGEGEKKARELESSRNPLSIQKARKRNQAERDAEALEAAKNLGNYHPIIKNLFRPNDPPKPARKRIRGLSMGVGRYTSSGLQLSKEEVATAQGQVGFKRDRRHEKSRGQGGRR